MKRLLAAVCALICVLTTRAFAAPYVTYSYDRERNDVEAPPLYLPSAYAGFDAPSDLCVYDNRVYILDAARGGVLIADEMLESARLLPLMRTASEPLGLIEGGGLFVAASGIYISDPGALCVYAFGHDGILRHTYTAPDSYLYDDTVPFRVRRVLCDSAGTIYALVEGLYAGAVLFSPDGEFLGFFGANEVQMTAAMYIDSLWKRLLSDEQKEAMSRFLPVAYSAFDIDDENFVFTCSDASVPVESARVRKLNPSGASLWNNAEMLFGDYITEQVEGLQNVTSFVDIAVDENGILAVLDAAKGRIFVYDSSGEIMGIFGGRGQQVGTFTSPTAIDMLGSLLYVLDSKEASVTVFSLTEYGEAYRAAVLLGSNGDYTAAMPYLNEVLRRNPYAQNACVGMAKALFAQGDVSGALDYMRRSGDRAEYSRMFSRYRLELVRQNFTFIVLVLALSAVAIWLLARKKWHGRLARRVGYHMHIVLHPIDGLEEARRGGGLSLWFAAGICAAWLLVDILRYFATGFIFNSNDPAAFSLAGSIVSTVLLYLAWTVTNWAIASLSDGKGTLGVLLRSNAYALVPHLAASVLVIALSHIFTEAEGGYLGWINAAGLIWSGGILFCLTMTAHSYEFGKTVVNLLLTAVGVVIVLLLMFGVVVLFEQVSNLFGVLYGELALRR